jgi:hypothetical protein
MLGSEVEAVPPAFPNPRIPLPKEQARNVRFGPEGLEERLIGKGLGFI